MSALLALLLAAIPNVLLAIFSKLVTEKFLNSLLTRLIVFGLKKAAALSINTIDDDIVADIERRFNE